jgi:peptidoglycan/LPS O-acetylase OafA/YrhL
VISRFNHLGRLRIFLATLVLISHAFPLTNAQEPLGALTGSVTGGSIAVVGFFFISGFLVTRSWIRVKRPIEFVVNRLFRIWPALFIALVFGASIGVVVSTAKFNVALTSAWHYFAMNLPLINGISFQIEGAFLNHPNPSINGSLWTLEWEVFCYISVWVIGLIGCLRGRVLPLVTVFMVLVGIYLVAVYDISLLRGSLDIALILFSFSLGALGFFIHSMFGGYYLTVGLLLAGLISKFAMGDLALLMPVFLVCGIITLISFTTFLPNGDAKSDPSYGIYIFAFPVQQLVVWFYPDCSPLQNIMYSLPVVYVMGMLSWHYVERPMIRVGRSLFSSRTPVI